MVHGLLEITPPRLGDVVVVQGAGPVGLASAMYANIAGAAKVVLVGGPASRLELALDLGACDVALDIFSVPDPAERTARVLAETPAGRGADLVVEATGAPQAVGEGLDLCRKNGRYLVVGQYTDHGAVPLNPHLITRKQLKVFGSWAMTGEHYVKHVAAVPLLAQRFDLGRLVTRYHLGQANQALADMRSGVTLKPVLSP